MIIGITGRVGSGKSYLWDLLEKTFPNFFLIDLDVVGHELLEKNEVKGSLKKFFGDRIFHLDGMINRKVLGELVFSSLDQLKKLNDISHPLIRQQVVEKIKQKLDKEPTCKVIIMGALLPEIGLYDLCNRVVVVDAEDDKICSFEYEKFTRISPFQRSRDMYLSSGSDILRNSFDDQFEKDAIVLFNSLFNTTDIKPDRF